MAGKRWWICEALREPMFQVAQAFLMLCTYCAKSTNIINLMFRSLYENLRGLLQRWSAPKISAGNMDFSRLLADAQKERNRLWESPPLCGSVVRYAQKCGHDDAHGEFLFKTADVEQALRDSLQENPHLTNSDDGAMLRWVQRRDDSLTKPSDVPSIWSRFKYVANDLVRAGNATQ